MKRKLLTVLLMSAMVLAGSTVAKADDVFDSNTEETSQIDMNMENPSEANPEDTIGNLDEIADEVSDKERNTEDFITTYADGIAIDEAHFPDEGFRKYLKDNFDKNGDDSFSQDEIDSITTITYCTDKKLKSLNGINYFTSLTYLQCSGGGLTKLDVSQNPNLSTLYCDGNQLTSLDISQNPNLTYLWCSANQLTSLDVSQNPRLSSLNCESNQLTLLDVSMNPNLSSLTCRRNQLTSLDVSQNSDLSWLACENNQLTSLDVSGNTKLSSLSCGNNRLTSLDVSQNPNLSSLDCMSSQLTTLDVTKNPNLSHLKCGDNQLTSLDISMNPNLSYLWCGSNQLTSLDVSKKPSLKGLGCEANQLTSLDVSENPNLNWLNCADNQLKSLDVNVHLNLNNLWCAGNHLPKLDLSNNKQMFIRNIETLNPMHDSLRGAYVTPQDIYTEAVSTNGTWVVDLAAIVGKENLDRVTLATDGAKLSADGTVTFSGSTVPTELVYNYDTKNPAEDTPMTVHVALTRNNVDDQTGKDVTVDTGDLDIDKICKENNISMNANVEIILSQGTPSKESLDKLTQAAGTNGYSISAAYEILMTLFSDGQKIADITDNFGRIKLTFQVNASLAGQNAVVYQLHNNSQVIVHDGLTINTDGTVMITVDKFSSFAVAVKSSSNNTDKPDTDQPGTNKPDSNRPDTNKPATNQSNANQPNTNQSNGGQSDVKQTNTNQLSPKTGDSTNPAFWLLVAMVASITSILNRKRFYKH